MDTFTIEQKKAIDSVLSGRNTIITGEGGTGKSKIINFVVNELKKKRKNVKVLATTGCAAHLIGEGTTTIHSVLGLGEKSLNLHRKSQIIGLLKKKRELGKTNSFNKFVNDNDSFIFDEMSMFSAACYETLDWAFRYETGKLSRPFGGKHIVFTFDLLQLGPIPISYPSAKGRTTKTKMKDHDYIFHSGDFDKLFVHTILNPCIFILNKNFRSNDKHLTSDLKYIRKSFKYCNDPNPILKRLNERRRSCIDDIRTDFNINEDDVIWVMTTKDKVREKNEQMIGKLTTEMHIFTRTVHTDEFIKRLIKEEYNEKEIQDWIKNRTKFNDDLGGYETEEITDAHDEITKGCFRVCVGARVMLRRNLDVNAGLINGARGVVQEVSENIIKVKFDGIDGVKEITRMTYTDPEYSEFKIHAFPLIKSWAITIHKLQGHTIRSPIVVDLTNYDTNSDSHDFTNSLLYVAFSRITKYDDLHIISPIPLGIEHFPSRLCVREWYDKQDGIFKNKKEELSNHFNTFNSIISVR